MKNFSLLGMASFLPERVVTRDFFGSDEQTGMFKGSKERRHSAPDETAAGMIYKATIKLCDRLNLDPARDIGLILSNVSIPDIPFTGAGASAAKLLGARPELILDVHNSGCVSFVYMMRIARSLLESTVSKTVLICNVQNAAGRIFSHPGNLSKPQAAIPGDGCGVGLFALSDISPVESIVTHAHGEYADDMRMVSDDGLWYEPRRTPMYIDFDESRVANIVARGNIIVPEAIREACLEANVKPNDADVLITNQPNPIFLRNWREALQIPKERQVHTFEEHGNTFGAAIPISLERAYDLSLLKKNSKILLGGFSHAGDYTAAAVITWQKT